MATTVSSYLNIKYNVLYSLLFREKGLIFYLSRYIYYRQMIYDYENIKDNINKIYGEKYRYKNIADGIAALRLKKCYSKKDKYYKKITEYFTNNIKESTLPKNIINNMNKVQLFIGYSTADLFYIADLFSERYGKTLKINISEDIVIELELSRYIFTEEDLHKILEMNKKESNILNDLD